MTASAPEDLLYRTVDGIDLMGRLYRPNTEGPAPFVIDSHGGAWQGSDRTSNAVIHEDFAAHGIGVFALDFRLSTQAQFPAPVQDINFGVRWFKANAGPLGLAPNLIGGLGSSSGGQQMGLVAFRPDDPLYCVEDSSLGETDAGLDFFLAGWPILDPLARYRMAQERDKERLVAAHDAYFPDEEAMVLGNPHLVIERGEATRLPPTIIVQGTADENVEHDRADLFADFYRAAGGTVEVHKYDGMPHTFVTADPDAEASKAAIVALREFVLAQTG